MEPMTSMLETTEAFVAAVPYMRSVPVRTRPVPAVGLLSGPSFAADQRDRLAAAVAGVKRLAGPASDRAFAAAMAEFGALEVAEAWCR